MTWLYKGSGTNDQMKTVKSVYNETKYEGTYKHCRSFSCFN